jgi:phosphoglycolate phosphatase
LHDLFFPYYEANVAVLSRPFDGVPELLDTLSEKGCAARRPAPTSSRPCRNRCSEQLGWPGVFGAIAGRDTFAVLQAGPGASDADTIAMAGGSIARAVMVGDSEVDVATAMAADVPCIGVSFGYTPRPMRELGRTLSSITTASSCPRCRRWWAGAEGERVRCGFVS